HARGNFRKENILILKGGISTRCPDIPHLRGRYFPIICNVRHAQKSTFTLSRELSNRIYMSQIRKWNIIQSLRHTQAPLGNRSAWPQIFPAGLRPAPVRSGTCPTSSPTRPPPRAAADRNALEAHSPVPARRTPERRRAPFRGPCPAVPSSAPRSSPHAVPCPSSSPRSAASSASSTRPHSPRPSPPHPPRCLPRHRPRPHSRPDPSSRP